MSTSTVTTMYHTTCTLPGNVIDWVDWPLRWAVYSSHASTTSRIPGSRRCESSCTCGWTVTRSSYGAADDARVRHLSEAAWAHLQALTD